MRNFIVRIYISTIRDHWLIYGRVICKGKGYGV